MSFKLNDLSNNIADSIKSIGGQLGISSKKEITNYPDVLGDIKTKFAQENWNKLPLPYTFAVINIETGDSSSDFKDFALPLAPQEIDQLEKIPSKMTVTQGGSVSSHKGNKFKTLKISGTTGVAPFRGAGGVNKSTGEAIFQPNSLKFKSGYEVFHELRNYFKAYYQWKKDTKDKNHRLIFKNYKDGEFLVVKLETFQMKRTAARSFLYDYVLDFTVLKHFEFKTPELSTLAKVDAILNGALAKIDTARGVFLRSSDIIKQIESTYESALLDPIKKTSAALKALLGFGMDLANFPSNIKKTTISAKDALAALVDIKSQFSDLKNKRGGPSTPQEKLLSTVKLPNDLDSAVERSGVDALDSLKDSEALIPASDLPESAQEALDKDVNNTLGLPRSYYTDTITEITRIKENAEDYFNLGSSDYDTIFDRTSTVTTETTKVPTNDELELLNAFNLSISGISDLVSTSVLFKSNYDEQLQSIISLFDENELALENTDAVIQITLPAKTDLEDLALKYLNDKSRWPEIAELNALKAPYVIQDVASVLTNVAKPGDSLLIPSAKINGFGDAPDTLEIPSTVNLTKLEKSLGTDFMVTDTFDLAISNSGDLQVVSGVVNMAQAVVLKLAYEKGEVKHAPEIGASLSIGKKVKPLSETKDEIIRTLLQDNRIARVTNMELFRSGPATSISFLLFIKQIDIPVPVNIKL